LLVLLAVAGQLLLALAGPAPVMAGGPCATIAAPCALSTWRPQDEVWLISTRGLGLPRAGCCLSGTPRFQRWDPRRGWQPAGAAEFHAAGASPRITCFYVHGNQIQAGRAPARGWRVYLAILGGRAEAPPLRYVIWSWPSDRASGPLRDARIKAARTDVDGFYLASVLAEMPPGPPVSLIGFSFGSRVITGASHLLGGGVLAGRALPRAGAEDRVRPRTVLLAAALETGWLQPGHCHGQAVAQMESLLLLYNSCDPLLRRYRFLTGDRRSTALGFTGLPPLGRLGGPPTNFRQRDLAPLIGRVHDWNATVGSRAAMADVSRVVLDPPAPPAGL